MASLLWEIMRWGDWREISRQVSRGKGNSKVKIIVERLNGVIRYKVKNKTIRNMDRSLESILMGAESRRSLRSDKGYSNEKRGLP